MLSGHDGALHRQAAQRRHRAHVARRSELLGDAGELGVVAVRGRRVRICRGLCLAERVMNQMDRAAFLHSLFFFFINYSVQNWLNLTLLARSNA